MSQSPALSAAPPQKTSRILLAAIVLGTLALGCAYSSQTLIWGDELIAYFGIQQPSLSQVVHNLRTPPLLMLEPPLTDILAYLIAKPFAYAPLAVRALSILSFALTQLFLFAIARRLGSARAGYLAMLAVVCCHIYMWYAPCYRPYSFLMAMTAASIYYWLRTTDTTYHSLRQRLPSLAAFTLFLILLINCHFFGFAAVLPIFIGEAVRSHQRRQLDWPLLGALLLGSCSLALDLPFILASTSTKLPVTFLQAMHIRDIPGGYIDLLPNLRHLIGPPLHLLGLHPRLNPLVGVLLFVCFISAISAILLRLRKLPAQHAQFPAITALIVLSLLQVPIALVGWFFTHTYNARYGVEAILGFVLLLCIAISPLLERWSSRRYAAFFSLFLCLTLYSQYFRLQSLHAHKLSVIAQAQTPPQLLAQLRADPGKHVYLTVYECLHDALYTQPEVLPHLRCLYSPEREKYMLIYYTKSQAEQALIQRTPFPIRFSTYEEFQQDLPSTLVYSTNGEPLSMWDVWIIHAIDQDTEPAHPTGEYGLGGTIYSIDK